MPRPLPSAEEAAAILAKRRPRPVPRPPRHAARGLTKLIKALDERYGGGPGDPKVGGRVAGRPLRAGEAGEAAQRRRRDAGAEGGRLGGAAGAAPGAADPRPA